MREARRRIPSDERIHRRRQRIEIPPDPAETLRIAWIGSGPDIGAEEMRAALILVPGALNERQAALVENLLHPGESRMQTEGDARRIGADLQHLARRHG